MTDKEKVIKGLEYHLKELTVGKTCFECPYLGDNPCEINLIANAIAMLKEQEELARSLHEVQHPCNIIERYEPDEKGWRFGAKKKLFDDGNNTGK